MPDIDFLFFAEVLVGGLLAGVMYSLVAIGFVLIYKTSHVLNFAQGSMVLLAALTFVSLLERGVPFWASLLLALAVMVLLGLSIERTVLRPLVNKPPITLFMATLGLSYVIEGVAQLVWGTQVHGLELGIDDKPFEFAGILISKFDLVAAGIAAAMGCAARRAVFAFIRGLKGSSGAGSGRLRLDPRSHRRWPLNWSWRKAF
jgi:branched-chain amino acid transport system permease protein